MLNRTGFNARNQYSTYYIVIAGEQSNSVQTLLINVTVLYPLKIIDKKTQQIELILYFKIEHQQVKYGNYEYINSCNGLLSVQIRHTCGYTAYILMIMKL